MPRSRPKLTAARNEETVIDPELYKTGKIGEGATIGRIALNHDRLAASAPYLIALAAGIAALGQALLAGRYAAPIPISVTSGCMLSAMLLVGQRKQWRIGLTGFAVIFVALAVSGQAIAASASTAAITGVMPAIVRRVLNRSGAPRQDFQSLKSLKQFCVSIGVVHVAVGAPLLFALSQATGQEFLPGVLVQSVLSSALGMAIFAHWLVPLFRRQSAGWLPVRHKAEIWASMVAVALLSMLIFNLIRNAPLFLVLAMITYLAFRLGASATAFAIVVVSGVATKAFLLEPGGHLAWGGNSLENNLILQIFLTTCFAVGMSVAAALADKARLGARLAESQQHFQSALQTTGHIVFRTDVSGRYTYLSPVWERVMGIPVSAAIGRPAFEFMVIADRKDSNERLKSFIKSEIAGGRSLRSFVRADGETLAMEITYRHRLAADGSLAGIDGAMHDITDLRVVEAELERTRAELIHASRLSAMAALTSTIAHELNQPLLAVANFARGLKRVLKSETPDLSPFVAETLDDIDAGVLRAATIVKRMRSLVEKSSILKERHSLADIVEDSRAIGLIDAASRGIECVIDLSDEADAVLVDHIQIQQVMVNLLRNAVDAMEGVANPQIVIRSQAHGEWVEVNVADQGHGISEEALANVFKPFDTKKIHGMGVGLSISRTIIEAHGGKFWVENRFPSGACFKFTLPRGD